MKRSLTQSGPRAICAGLVALSAVGWSCTKEPAFGGAGPQAEGAIAQARFFYESTAPSLTKSVGEQQIPIKPLPGEITPLWDRATATVLADGTTAWVDVPIESTISYTAVRGGHHRYEAGEECGHDHTPVQAVQKLSVYTAADGTQQSLIATIVPEADCTANLNDFSSATGLAGFSGFVSWHDLSGKLIRVAGYENGTKTKSVEPTGDNEVEILEVVDDAILYPSETEVALSSIVTKAGGWYDKCNYCHEKDCKAKDEASQHCIVCGKYDPPQEPTKSQCVCARCSKCGLRYKGMWLVQTICKCGGKVDKKSCTYCNKLLCNHVLYGADFGSADIPKLETTVHEEILKEIFAYEFSVGEFRFAKDGSHFIDNDNDYQSAGYEYLHGLYAPVDNSSQVTALANMRTFFIHKMKGFVQTKEMLSLGEGFHPVLDTYVEMQTRKDMLNYYTYANLNNVVHGMNTAPYVNNPVPCTEAVTYIFNALKDMPSRATDAEIGAVFDQWVSMAGSDKPGLMN